MTYAERHAALIAYLKVKTEERDWHGVSDAANDLRVLEAQINATPMTATEVLENRNAKAAWPTDEGQAPPPPPKPKHFIPTDPEALRQEATRLMDAGFGMNEVKERLELTQEQASQIFFGSSVPRNG